MTFTRRAADTMVAMQHDGMVALGLQTAPQAPESAWAPLLASKLLQKERRIVQLEAALTAKDAELAAMAAAAGSVLPMETDRLALGTYTTTTNNPPVFTVAPPDYKAAYGFGKRSEVSRQVKKEEGTSFILKDGLPFIWMDSEKGSRSFPKVLTGSDITRHGDTWHYTDKKGISREIDLRNREWRVGLGSNQN